MPPKRNFAGRQPQSQSTFSSAYSAVTSPENRTIVTALGMFAVSFFARDYRSNSLRQAEQRIGEDCVMGVGKMSQERG